MRCSGCVSKSATFFANNPVAFFIYLLHFLLVALLLHFVSGFATVSSSAVELPMKQFEDDNPLLFSLLIHCTSSMSSALVPAWVPARMQSRLTVHEHGTKYSRCAACHSVARVLQPTIILAQCCLVLSRVLYHVKPRPAELVCAGLVWFIVRLAFVLFAPGMPHILRGIFVCRCLCLPKICRCYVRECIDCVLHPSRFNSILSLRIQRAILIATTRRRTPLTNLTLLGMMNGAVRLVLNHNTQWL